MKKIFALLLTVLLLAALSVPACAADELTPLVVGASSTPHAEVLELVKDQLAEEGYDLQIVIYDDYILPNTALEDGDLDANYFQHTPYLNSFNESNGTHLVSVARSTMSPSASTARASTIWPICRTAPPSSSPATTPTAPAPCCSWPRRV